MIITNSANYIKISGTGGDIKRIPKDGAVVYLTNDTVILRWPTHHGGGSNELHIDYNIITSPIVASASELMGLMEKYLTSITGVGVAMNASNYYDHINKKGENPDIDIAGTPEVIWDYGGPYYFSTTAAIDTISSDNNGDTQDIIILGLDANWDRVTQTKTLTGQVKATLDTPLIRVYDKYNDSATDLAGNVYCYEDTVIAAGVPVDGTKIRSLIRAGNNQTLMCVYPIPAGKTGYLTSEYATLSKKQAAIVEVTWQQRLFGKIFRVGEPFILNTAGTSVWPYKYEIPDVLPEKTDILMSVEDTSADNTGVSGGFTILLVDND